MSPLILASSSPFRRQLLERLGLPFQCVAPDIDETAQADESIPGQVQRLAGSKAHAVADSGHEGLIIGSDQLAVCAGEVFGKPGNHARATQQLQRMAGRVLHFYTGLYLLNTHSGREQLDTVEFEVRFRHFSDAEIARYLEREEPYDCAAAFKSEAFGISLVEHMQGPDPTALIGLPLISLAAMLRSEGLQIP